MPSNHISQRLLAAAEHPWPGSPRLLLIGVDHRCAPLELREKVAYDTEAAEDLLRRLMATPEIDEACVISTCNRTEIYLLPSDEGAAYRTGLEMAFLSRTPRIGDEGRFFVEHDYFAARHLLELASGLQSMVLGEPEILSQVKQATDLSEALGASGMVLQRLLRTAIAAGGKARAETGIGAGAVSIAYAVVDLARGLFQRVEDCDVLMIGAGEMARQAARAFADSGVRSIAVTNRSPERARELAELVPRARIVPFAERGRALVRCDVVVASTTADEPILGPADLRPAVEARASGPLLIADLGVPRNVDPRAGEIEHVVLHDIDSLETLISRNLEKRREEVPRVQKILDRELEVFTAWHRGLAARPIVAALQRQAERVRRQEVDSARTRFPPETHEALDRLTRSLVRKILHHPSVHLRQGESPDPAKLDLVRELFRLDEDS